MKYLKSYIYFWFIAFTIFLIGLFYRTNEDVIVINIHDTYYVISNLHISIIFAMIYSIIGFAYWTLDKTTLKLYSRLTQIHTLISIGCFLVFIAGILYFNKIKTENEFPLFYDSLNENTFVVLVFTIFFVFQFLLIVNLIVSTLKQILLKKVNKL
jgi:heme/copper-type cytochrome/quinol oxidase subunit 1